MELLRRREQAWQRRSVWWSILYVPHPFQLWAPRHSSVTFEDVDPRRQVLLLHHQVSAQTELPTATFHASVAN